MFNNQDYPWYLQKSPTFTSLYEGVFDVVSLVSPLDLGLMFDLENAETGQLYSIGAMWGMASSKTYFDGMIYDIDNWSELKVWTGGIKPVALTLYRRFVAAKIYSNEMNYSLTMLHDVLEMIFEDYTHEITVDENEEEHTVTINIRAKEEIIRLFIELRAFDRYFLGTPSGVSVKFNYEMIS